MDRSVHRYLRLSVVSFIVLAAFGCGSDYPPTAEVSGTVTLDGKPLPNAIVTFMPTDGRRSATGYTDEDGQFTLTTFQEGDGAVPGTHQVAVYPKTPPPMPGEVSAMGGPVKSPQKKYTPPFPARYGNPETSGFQEEVTQEGENDFEFALTSGA